MAGLTKVMFSAVQGVVLKDGKPLTEVKVLRTFKWTWNDTKQHDETTTDANGKFNFALASRISLITSISPHEPVIYQTIKIIYEGKEHMAWELTKHNYRENGELKGKKINIECKIEKKEGYHINTDIWGICTLK